MRSRQLYECQVQYSPNNGVGLDGHVLFEVESALQSRSVDVQSRVERDPLTAIFVRCSVGDVLNESLVVAVVDV